MSAIDEAKAKIKGRKLKLVMPDGGFAPAEVVRMVGIGTRVRMVMTPVAPGLALPQWTVDETADQPAKPWRYPD